MLSSRRSLTKGTEEDEEVFSPSIFITPILFIERAEVGEPVAYRCLAGTEELEPLWVVECKVPFVMAPFG